MNSEEDEAGGAVVDGLQEMTVGTGAETGTWTFAIVIAMIEVVNAIVIGNGGNLETSGHVVLPSVVQDHPHETSVTGIVMDPWA